MTDPTTIHDVETRLLAYAGQLGDLIDEHAEVGQQLARAKVAYERAYLTAHLASVAEHPKRRVQEHDNHAKHAALDEYETLVFVEERERTIRTAINAIKQMASTSQTLARIVADEAGHGRYGSRR